METGAFNDRTDNHGPSTFVDYMKNKYYEKPDVSEFLNFKTPAEYSFDVIMNNTKMNFDRFAVYHFAIAASLYLLFILTSPMFVIPFGIIFAAFYIIKTKQRINGTEVTPQQALIGCAGLNALLFLCFPQYFVSRMVYFFSINALCVLSVVVHSQFVKSVDEEEDKL